MYDDLGIARGYHDIEGNWHDTPVATLAHFRATMGEPGEVPPMWFVDAGSAHPLLGRCRVVLEDGTDLGEVDRLPADLPLGYHRLEPVDGAAVTSLVVSPRQCPSAPWGWGVAAQVYSLWRPDAWGIGDLRDVEELGRRVAGAGGVAVLLSPLHAPAPTLPQEPSPYYPSSRRWLNPLLLPIDAPRPAEVPNSPDGIIDRDRVWAAKRQALATRFQQERSRPEWRGWSRSQGEDLWRYCVWSTLAERLGPQWRQWPADYRHPASLAVLDLPVNDHSFAERCEFHAWLQWLVRQEVLRASSGSGVALISDLAVGCSSDGADAWLYQDVMNLGAQIGAPPDAFNAAGQDWGLPPFVPWRLRAQQYRPFIGMVRAACEGMGGVRIDHVMGLFRQFWIPSGGTPKDGTYVRMPSDDLLAIIRLEAARAGAFVVGEDLGTVEPGVRESLRDSGVLGTKVWWFDTDVSQWPPTNLATVTTHDLPTVAGVWEGTDGSDDMRGALRALVGDTGDAEAASLAVHRAAAASPARLCLATTDDLAGATDRPNHPGTTNDEFPNWCIRLPVAVDALLDGSTGTAIIEAMRAGRTRQ